MSQICQFYLGQLCNLFYKILHSLLNQVIEEKGAAV